MSFDLIKIAQSGKKILETNTTFGFSFLFNLKYFLSLGLTLSTNEEGFVILVPKER